MIASVIFLSILVIFIIILFCVIAEKGERGTVFFFMCLAVAATFLVGVYLGERLGSKSTLDGNGIYKKEYTYKQLPSGEYVKTDSSYVRIKTKNK